MWWIFGLYRDEISIMKRLLICILAFMVAIGLVVYGIKQNEFIEVERNATILCLSCIGIG